MISTPFCLYDCDVPCDGGTAVIVSRVDTVRRTCASRRSASRRSAPRSHGRPSWDQFDDLTTMANRDAGAQLWTRTDLKPSDVQMLAGCTTASRSSRCRGSRRSGFCGVGESGPFIEGGAAHRARRRAAAQHARRPALGRPAARLRLPARGVRAAVGRSRRPPGRDAARGRRRSRAGGGNTCGCLLLVRDVARCRPGRGASGHRRRQPRVARGVLHQSRFRRDATAARIAARDLVRLVHRPARRSQPRHGPVASSIVLAPRCVVRAIGRRRR